MLVIFIATMKVLLRKCPFFPLSFLLVGHVDNVRDCAFVRVGDMCDISVHSPQLCYESNSALTKQTKNSDVDLLHSHGNISKL